MNTVRILPEGEGRMATSLAEALNDVELETGRTYRCRVKEFWVELRVLDTSTLTRVLVAGLCEAQGLVERQLRKAADIRGRIRAGRVYGWYYLPKSAEHDLAESIVDLHQLHTVRLELLHALCQRGHRR